MKGQKEQQTRMSFSSVKWMHVKRHMSLGGTQIKVRAETSAGQSASERARAAGSRLYVTIRNSPFLLETRKLPFSGQKSDSWETEFPQKPENRNQNGSPEIMSCTFLNRNFCMYVEVY